MKWVLYLFISLVLIGCNAPVVKGPCVETAIVSDCVRINTRLVFLDKNDPSNSRQINLAKLYLSQCESFYRELNLSLEVLSIEWISEINDFTGWGNDARKHPDQLSIYFLPRERNFFSVDATAGIATFPWSNDYGICIRGEQDNPIVMAHEMGHWLGLYHVFSEDYVEDTPQGDGAFGDPLDHNIMSYNIRDWSEQTITKGQLARAKYCLYLYRHNTFLP